MIFCNHFVVSHTKRAYRNKVDDYRDRLYADIKKAKQESNQKRVKQSIIANSSKQEPTAPNQEAVL